MISPCVHKAGTGPCVSGGILGMPACDRPRAIAELPGIDERPVAPEAR
jgi:hypothetical protein